MTTCERVCMNTDGDTCRYTCASASVTRSRYRKWFVLLPHPAPKPLLHSSFDQRRYKNYFTFTFENKIQMAGASLLYSGTFFTHWGKEAFSPLCSIAPMVAN